MIHLHIGLHTGAREPGGGAIPPPTFCRNGMDMAVPPPPQKKNNSGNHYTINTYTHYIGRYVPADFRSDDSKFGRFWPEGGGVFFLPVFPTLRSRISATDRRTSGPTPFRRSGGGGGGDRLRIFGWDHFFKFREHFPPTLRSRISAMDVGLYRPIRRAYWTSLHACSISTTDRRT